MKRAAEEVPECKKASMITIEDVDCQAIMKLRCDIMRCAEAPRRGCDGVQRFNPKYFEDTIEALGDDIVNCDCELENAWFAGFVKTVGSNRRHVMVTNSRIRKVSVEANTYFRCICV